MKILTKVVALLTGLGRRAAAERRIRQHRHGERPARRWTPRP